MTQVVVIGAGQAGLAAGFYLRRAGLDFVLLDAQEVPGGACLGFRPELRHLAPLQLRLDNGLIQTEGTRVITEPRLHLLGYGDWTGPASATLIGVGPTARTAVSEIAMLLGRAQGRR